MIISFKTFYESKILDRLNESKLPDGVEKNKNHREVLEIAKVIGINKADIIGANVYQGDVITIFLSISMDKVAKEISKKYKPHSAKSTYSYTWSNKGTRESVSVIDIGDGVSKVVFVDRYGEHVTMTAKQAKVILGPDVPDKSWEGFFIAVRTKIRAANKKLVWRDYGFSETNAGVRILKKAIDDTIKEFDNEIDDVGYWNFELKNGSGWKVELSGGKPKVTKLEPLKLRPSAYR